MNLGQLLVSATGQQPPQGTKNGICVMCGNGMENGLPMKEVVSNNFTGWGRLFAGDGICPPCAYLFNTEFRRNCWVASPGSFQLLDRKEVCDILLNPPEPPFFIYIRKAGIAGGRKQGWLSCVHKIARSRDRYHFAHEDFDIPIWFERERAEEYLRQIQEAITLSISKKALRGDLNVYNCKKAFEAGKMDLITAIRENHRNPLWEVLIDVYVVPKTGARRDRIAGINLQQGQLVTDEGPQPT